MRVSHVWETLMLAVIQCHFPNCLILELRLIRKSIEVFKS